jgi:hypothetical protein
MITLEAVTVDDKSVKALISVAGETSTWFEEVETDTLSELYGHLETIGVDLSKWEELAYKKGEDKS